jgi:N-acylneuraminate cytidylyltransferase
MKFFIIIKENSERVPRKNFIRLNHIPLWKNLIYELEGEDVYIDTDSKQILEECKTMSWVTAYPRKQEFIDFESNNNKNYSPVLLMINNFLDNYVNNEDEIIVTPHVTSPFLKLDTIKKASKKLEEGHDSINSVTEHKEFSYYKGTPINFKKDVVQKTQDLEPIMMSNGAFFIFKKKTFKKHNNRVGTNPYFYTLPSIEDIEIDTHSDLNLAKIVAKGLEK